VDECALVGVFRVLLVGGFVHGASLAPNHLACHGERHAWSCCPLIELYAVVVCVRFGGKDEKVDLVAKLGCELEERAGALGVYFFPKVHYAGVARGDGLSGLVKARGLVGVWREGIQIAVSDSSGKHLDLLVGREGGKCEWRHEMAFDDVRGSERDVSKKTEDGDVEKATGWERRRDRQQGTIIK
jgi:hypothetical protein